MISPTKAKAPVHQGQDQRHRFDDDDDDDIDRVAAPAGTLTTNVENIPAPVDGSNPLGMPGRIAPALLDRATTGVTTDGDTVETLDAAGAVAAAEIVQLENLVTVGDGKHDVFTCHCWGLEASLWAANESGQLVSILTQLEIRTLLRCLRLRTCRMRILRTGLSPRLQKKMTFTVSCVPPGAVYCRIRFHAASNRFSLASPAEFQGSIDNPATWPHWNVRLHGNCLREKTTNYFPRIPYVGSLYLVIVS